MYNYMLKLLYTIPTPFYESKYKPDSQYELAILYSLAKQNKIELMLLEYLDSVTSLPYIFRERLLRLRRQRIEMIITANKILEIIEHLGYKAATFKSWVPFPALPNDIDAIILDELKLKDFNSIVQELVNKYDYQIFDIIPYAVSIHDKRAGNHLYPEFKDPFDVDLYFEVAANKIIYLNKRLLVRHQRKLCINNDDVLIYSLPDEQELLTQLVHCFFPEQMFLLYHYYTALYFFNTINIEYFFRLAEKFHIDHIITYSLALVIDMLTVALKQNKNNKDIMISYVGKEFLNMGYYRFKLNEILPMILYKAKRDNIFMKSLIAQAISLMDIKNLKHVLMQIVNRRTRITY